MRGVPVLLTAMTLASVTEIPSGAYKMAFATREGLWTAIVLMILPFAILWVLLKLLPP